MENTQQTNYGTPFTGFKGFPKPPFEPIAVSTGTYRETLGSLILQERKRRKWSQQDLALRVGCDRKTIAAAETNTGQVSFDTILSILTTLRIHMTLSSRDDFR